VSFALRNHFHKLLHYSTSSEHDRPCSAFIKTPNYVLLIFYQYMYTHGAVLSIFYQYMYTHGAVLSIFYQYM